MSEEKSSNDKLRQIKEANSKFLIYIEDINAIPSKSMKVFYNKKMEINRDITSLAIQAYHDLYIKENLIIIDSMAGSGISSIRLLNECKDIDKIYINDINPVAEDLIYKNLKLNNLIESSNVTIKVLRKDANLLLSKFASKSNYEKPNVISIDPWGTPNFYIDSAFKAIRNDNGLMCVTATDTAVLFGVKSDVCLRKYMAKPLHNDFCKEIGARILIYFISRIANINNMGIIPLLTFYSNHFIRVFVKTFKNKNQIVKHINKYGYIIHCKNCDHSFTINIRNLISSKICGICGEDKSLNYAGPLWLDEIHHPDFLKRIKILNDKSDFRNKKRIQKMVNFCLQEIGMPPNYFNLHKLCKKMKCKSIPNLEQLIETLKNKGYKASRTHFDFISIKTDIDIISLKKILSN